MRKLERLKLARDLFGLNLPTCPEHNLPLLRHEDLRIDDEGCWDCPHLNAAGEPDCDFHIHEFEPKPWTGVDFGEEENVIQKFRRIENNVFFDNLGLM